MRLLLASAIALGGVIGGIQVGVPTLAIAHDKPAAAGLLIAMLSIGGDDRRAAYGARQWAAGPARGWSPLTSAITVCSRGDGRDPRVWSCSGCCC